MAGNGDPDEVNPGHTTTAYRAVWRTGFVTLWLSAPLAVPTHTHTRTVSGLFAPATIIGTGLSVGGAVKVA